MADILKNDPRPWKVKVYKKPLCDFNVCRIVDSNGEPINGLDESLEFYQPLLERIVELVNAEEIMLNSDIYPVPSELVSGITGKWTTLANLPKPLKYCTRPSEAVNTAMAERNKKEKKKK